MLGETDENWKSCVEQAVALEPDSVTIYQMELPFNTTISADTLKGTGRFSEHANCYAPSAAKFRAVKARAAPPE